MKKFSELSLVVFSLFLLSLGGCKKHSLPPPATGNPVFTMFALLGNDTVDIAAGAEDYYMATHFSQDNQGVYTYLGAFAPMGDTSRPGSWYIMLRGESTYPAQQFGQVSDAVFAGDYPYYAKQNLPGPGEYRFSSLATGSGGLAHHWVFGDGSFSNDVNPTHTFGAGAMFNVCLAIADSSGCTDTICNLVRPSSPVFGCSAGFSFVPDSGTSGFQFFAQPEGQGPFTYYWDFGNGLWSNLKNPVHYFNTPGTYMVCLTISASGSCQSVYCMKLNTNPFINPCLSNFKIEQGIDSLGLSTAEIRYHHPSGARYSSYRNGTQPGQSKFTVSEVEDYEPNKAGEPTKNVTATFNCVLYNRANPADSLIISEGKSVFAISYPD